MEAEAPVARIRSRAAGPTAAWGSGHESPWQVVRKLHATVFEGTVKESLLGSGWAQEVGTFSHILMARILAMCQKQELGQNEPYGLVWVVQVCVRGAENT